jgi:hypothetical protein
MNVPQLCALALITLAAPLGHAASAAAPAPDAETTVFVPRFITTEGNILAGKAFPVKTASCGTVMMSAYHLLGPSGGHTVQIPVAQLASKISRIDLHNMMNRKVMHTVTGASVTPPDAQPCCQEGKQAKGSGDVVAFRAPAELDGAALTVSTQTVRKGDIVRVITSVPANPRQTVVYEAVAEGMQDGYLMYIFKTPGFVLQATSGAPVINAAGEVVGINLGGGEIGQTKQLYGMANPSAAWLQGLDAQCKKTK